MKKLKWKHNKKIKRWSCEITPDGYDVPKYFFINKIREGYEMSPRAGIWFDFKKLSSAKKVAQLIHNG